MEMLKFGHLELDPLRKVVAIKTSLDNPHTEKEEEFWMKIFRFTIQISRSKTLHTMGRFHQHLKSRF